MRALLIPFFLIGQFTFAGQINLNGGDRIEIMANSRTIVTCAGGGSSPPGGSPCATAVEGYNRQFEFCMKAYAAPHCLQKTWPEFKQSTPDCVYEGIETCQRHCVKAYAVPHCMAYCK